MINVSLSLNVSCLFLLTNQCKKKYLEIIPPWTRDTHHGSNSGYAKHMLLVLSFTLALSLSKNGEKIPWLPRSLWNKCKQLDRATLFMTYGIVNLNLAAVFVGVTFCVCFLKRRMKDTFSIYIFFSWNFRCSLGCYLSICTLFAHSIAHKKKLKSVIAAIRPLYIVQCRVSLVSFVQKIVTMCLFYHTSCWCRFPSTLLRYTNNLQWRYTVIICVHYCTALLNMKLD